MNFAVSGSTGFVGAALVPFLEGRGYHVARIARGGVSPPSTDVVIHLAGLAHGRWSPEEFMRANRDGTAALAGNAAESGVRRFIFLSSVGAEVRASSPYGASKLAAEHALSKIDGVERVILRAPLIYGPGAKGNAGRLLRLAQSPLPLPLKTAAAYRTMIYIGNLIDALAFVAEAPVMGGKTLVATDPAPVSTAAIVAGIRCGARRSANLFAAPWLPALLRAARRSSLADQLFEELLFDGSELVKAGWRAPLDVSTALRLTGEAMIAKRT